MQHPIIPFEETPPCRTRPSTWCKNRVSHSQWKHPHLVGKERSRKEVETTTQDCGATVVCLSERWKELITPFLGKCVVSPNPIDSIHIIDQSIERIPHQLLLLGRDDAVKGHDFAFEIMKELEGRGSDFILHCTGKKKHQKTRTTSLHMVGFRMKKRSNCFSDPRSCFFHQRTKGNQWSP